MGSTERTAKVDNNDKTTYKGIVYGTCTACGAPVVDHDKYCSECGAKLDWSEE